MAFAGAEKFLTIYITLLFIYPESTINKVKTAVVWMLKWSYAASSKENDKRSGFVMSGCRVGLGCFEGEFVYVMRSGTKGQTAEGDKC